MRVKYETIEDLGLIKLGKVAKTPLSRALAERLEMRLRDNTDIAEELHHLRLDATMHFHDRVVVWGCVMATMTLVILEMFK